MPPDQVARDDALSRLPPAYSLALRLRDARLPADLIAECLAVEPEAVGPLLLLAEAKLAALCAGDERLDTSGRYS